MSQVEEYKQYKAYVPPKWSNFDRPNFSVHKDLSFAAMMPKNEAEVASLRKVAQQSTDAAARGSLSRPLKLSERWTYDMVQYCQQERLEREMIDRTSRLEAIMKQQHETSLARREREIVPPVLATSVLLASTSPQQSLRHPSDSLSEKQRNKIALLLRTAGDLHLSEVRDKCAECVEQRHRQTEANVVSHQAKVLKQKAAAQKRLALDLEERKEATDDHTAAVLEGYQRVLQDHVKKLEVEHNNVVARETSFAERKKAREEKERAAREVQAADFRRKVEQATEMKERVANQTSMELSRKLEESKTRLEEAELLRHRKVARQEGAKAYARALAHRDAERQKLLAEAAEREKVRIARVIRHDDELKEKAEAIHGKNETREESIARRKLETWKERNEDIEAFWAKHHTPSPSRSEQTHSKYEEDLAVHQSRIREQREMRETAAYDLMKSEFVKSQEREGRASARRAELLRRCQDDEEHRQLTRIKAAERELNRQTSVDTKAIQHAEKVEKQLARWRKERDEEREMKADAENSKIAKCIKSVNVDQRLELEDHMAEVEARRQKHRESQAATHAAHRLEREAHRQSVQTRISRHIESETREREENLSRRAKAHTEKCAQVVAQHDQRMYDLALAYREKDRIRKTQSDEAFAKRQRDFETGLQNTSKKDQRVRDHWAEKQTEDADDREQKSAARERHQAEIYHRMDSQRDEFITSTLEKLDYVKTRSNTSLEHRIQNVKSIERTRARSTSR